MKREFIFDPVSSDPYPVSVRFFARDCGRKLNLSFPAVKTAGV
jgi:hypothetical protein